ncbi:class A beta-lactamase-related serine hydrolase [Flavobacteriaceae bacterium KMM 6898]|nr:class A beta-lactamase-related serine hydrolase [Flavobacteriaceae bacterium KMM 6898]
MTRTRIIFALLVIIGTYGLIAQVDKSTPLFIELKKQDSIFFEKGFNQCDLTYLEAHLANNLKFYHDKSGFQDRNAFFENMQKYICSNPDKKPIRKVDEASLELFPLYNNGKLYGAIQKGIHHFYIRENGIEGFPTSTARFTHVWIMNHGIWQLSEALSYDHHEPQPKEGQAHAIEQVLKDAKVPALGLGIIENGKLTRIEVYGTLDTKTKAPYNTIFKVASLTKPIVALTALKLIDKGLLGLDEPLYPYWVDPDVKEDDRNKKLTPRLVLSHQTGFPNWRYLTDNNKLAFEFDPGTQFQYSGEGYEYLRKSIESKLGKSIEELTKEMLFEPAGMTDTRFWWDEAMDETRYAQNFDKDGKQIATTKYYEANAAANLLTTVEDYGRFIAYVINGAGLSDALFTEMQERQVMVRENNYFGLGWEILTGFSNGETLLLHSGKDPGVSTLAVFFPKSKNGYVVFLNGDNVNKVLEELLTNHLYGGKELWNKK